MSLILDALRKMEQERRSRHGGQDLRPEVLRYHSAGGIAPKQSARYPLLIIGVVLLCAGVGAGIMLKGKGGEVVPQASQAFAPVTPAPTPLPSEAPAPVALPPQALPGGPVVAPAAVEGDTERVLRAPVAAPSRPAPVEAMPQAQPRQEDAGEMQAGMPDITISGIAFQDERRMRRAVLNGVLVEEGAEIAGARVVEIRETKVRLSRGGRIFEIPFSSGFPSH